jgi:hypothetical protein
MDGIRLLSDRVLRYSCIVAGLFDLAVPSFAQSSIFVSLNNLDIYSVDMRNCTSRYVGTSDYVFVDIALTPSGQLYGLSGGDLYLIDTVNADVTFIGSSTSSGNSLVALNDSVLLVEDSAKLYGISTIDATKWLIGNIGYYGVGDLAWFQDELYLAAYYMLVRIALLPDATGIDSVVAMTSIGTMAMVPAYLNEVQSSLVGFIASGVICYSPFSGSYVEVCDVGLPDLATGGASFRLPLTPLIGCSQDNAINDNSSVPAVTIVQRKGVIQVTWMTEQVYEEWSIVDSQGRLVDQGKIGSSTQELSLPVHWETRGAYYLRIRGQRTQFVGRLLITE